MGGVVTTGIDLPSVHAALRLLGVKKRERRTVFEHLQEMERIALPLLNEREG
jgi:hypothetical protein